MDYIIVIQIEYNCGKVTKSKLNNGGISSSSSMYAEHPIGVVILWGLYTEQRIQAMVRSWNIVVKESESNR